MGTSYFGEDSDSREIELDALRGGMDIGLSLIDTAEMAADPDRDTVSAIAARWGFPDPHRFATEHEQAYRQPPGAVFRS